MRASVSGSQLRSGAFVIDEHRDLLRAQQLLFDQLRDLFLDQI